MIIPSNTNNAILVNPIFTVPRFDSAGGKMKYLTMTDPKKVSLLNFLSSNHKFWKFVDAGNTLLSLLLLLLLLILLLLLLVVMWLLQLLLLLLLLLKARCPGVDAVAFFCYSCDFFVNVAGVVIVVVVVVVVDVVV